MLHLRFYILISPFLRAICSQGSWLHTTLLVSFFSFWLTQVSLILIPSFKKKKSDSSNISSMHNCDIPFRVLSVPPELWHWYECSVACRLKLSNCPRKMRDGLLYQDYTILNGWVHNPQVPGWNQVLWFNFSVLLFFPISSKFLLI
jgi:hypothetical protein